MVSLVTMMSDGTLVEAATVGRDGIVGVTSAFAGRLAAPFESVVQIGDADALALAVDDLRGALADVHGLQRIVEDGCWMVVT